MANQNQAPVSKEQIEQAQSIWRNFTQFSKFGIIGICVALIILAVTLL
ncbi:MAG: hypothetical protein AAF988_04885 [Pseudomonadota bacterium]